MALDDFGAGYCGMTLLADLPTDIVKLDMDLTRNLHQRPPALAIVQAMIGLSRTLGFEIVAEGIETIEEYAAVRACGIRLIQGYLLAKPAFEALPGFSLPALTVPASLLRISAGHRKKEALSQLSDESVAARI
jgi:EAL domain-containing protein (putative c-di-GMP-specific phosphodiesterase class I)